MAPTPQGVSWIGITFEVHENHKLQVTSLDKSGGVEETIEARRSFSSLPEESIASNGQIACIETLMRAAEQGHIEVWRHLLEQGVDMNVVRRVS